MSFEQDYSPPRGTKYTWWNKPLNYSPWGCDLSQQYETKVRKKRPYFWLNPVRITLKVDEQDGVFHWWADIMDFAYRSTIIKGIEKNALRACLAAEKVGYAKLKEFLPPWVMTALANKWRPPCLPRPEWDPKTGFSRKTSAKSLPKVKKKTAKTKRVSSR